MRPVGQAIGVSGTGAPPGVMMTSASGGGVGIGVGAEGGMAPVGAGGLAALPFAGSGGGGGAGGGAGGASLAAALAKGVTGGSLVKTGDSSAGRSMSTGVGTGLAGPLFTAFSG